MDFSAANSDLWNPIIQIGVIAGLILLANVLRRKLSFIRKTLVPTAVLAGFLLLLIRTSRIFHIDSVLLEELTCHALAIGFIAMSLRIPEKTSSSSALIGSKSGALIVSTYLVQAIVGLVVSLGLAYTFMPDLFKASGILLPMGYGQGPGQANNVGTTYEALGMTGGRSFGLSLAAAGYLCACTVGVVFLNLYNRKSRINRVAEKEDISGSVTIDTFQDHNEIPISESIDKLSIQCALVAMLYLLTYYVTCGLTNAVGLIAPGAVGTVGTLLWGFNFIIGSLVAICCRSVLGGLRSAKIMNRQYQNNYLLYMCKKLYPDYVYEGFFSMYGMLTGTISSGVLLLREIDPEFKTPAANNLVTGSSFGIVFGAPVLLLVSLAPESSMMTFVVLGLVFIYLAVLLLFIFKVGKKQKR